MVSQPQLIEDRVPDSSQPEIPRPVARACTSHADGRALAKEQKKLVMKPASSYGPVLRFDPANGAFRSFRIGWTAKAAQDYDAVQTGSQRGTRDKDLLCAEG